MTNHRGVLIEQESGLPQPAAHPRVVIVGGGFAGLYAAKELDGAPVSVTLVDRLNYHLFQPLLYQVATAGLSAGNIAQPIRYLLSGSRNIAVLLAEVMAIDSAARMVVLDEGALPYDYLIVAAGARHSYLGRDDWEAIAPGLKDLDDAIDIRRRVLLSFEEAEREPDEARRRALLTFAIIGGGPTGVELAGALVELTRDALAREFRSIDPADARIIILERGPRLLAGFHEKLSVYTAQRLTALGVEVWTGTALTDMAPGVIQAGTTRLEVHTVLWAAGVRASSLGATLGAPVDAAGRVRVLDDLSVPGHPEVFVAGDLAALKNADGSWLPAMAPVAIQMGRHAARNTLGLARGDSSRPFRFHDRGMMATIGRNAAVAELGRLKFGGPLAWLAWLLVHIVYLIGFRNRLLVVIEWAWAYLTFNRGVRLITRRNAPPSPHRAEVASDGAPSRERTPSTSRSLAPR